MYFSCMLSPRDIKQRIGNSAVQFVEDGMTIGAGTGSTAYWFIAALGSMVSKGFNCQVVPTSHQTEILLREHKIPVITLNEAPQIDITIDGADEIDPQLNLIKGGGGALLQEKMVAFSSRKRIIIADESKLVQQLGKFPLPVEVIAYGYKKVQTLLEREFGIPVNLRTKDLSPFITDHGHYILDCSFQRIEKAESLSNYLNSIPGVVDNGLFLNMTTAVLIGYNNGDLKILP
jgi:ribose 5-phosphate isomerase A